MVSVSIITRDWEELECFNRLFLFWFFWNWIENLIGFDREDILYCSVFYAYSPGMYFFVFLLILNLQWKSHFSSSSIDLDLLVPWLLWLGMSTFLGSGKVVMFHVTICNWKHSTYSQSLKQIIWNIEIFTEQWSLI